jgi:hypothetical protein
LAGRNDEIRCVRCGSRWSVDANLRVRPINTPLSLHETPIADLKDWSDWQRRRLPDLLREEGRGPGGFGTSLVSLSRRKGTALERFGRGSLRLDEGEVLFESADLRLSFPVTEVSGFVDNFNVFSEFGHRGERWRLEFGEGNSAKWCQALSSIAPGGQQDHSGASA